MLEELQEEIRREAAYAFMAKCEYEIIVSPWPPGLVYEARLTSTGMVISKPWYDGDEVRLGIENPEILEINRMKTGKYGLQHVEDEKSKKVDVYMQLKPNMRILTEYIVKETGYRLAKKKEQDL